MIHADKQFAHVETYESAKLKMPIYQKVHLNGENRTYAVMVCMLPSSVVDHGFEPRSSQTKYCKNTLHILLLS